MKPRTAAVDALVDTITAERHVVEYLLFKLVTLKLLFVADQRRFLEQAANEAERVVDNLRQAEERRSAALLAVAADWDVDAETLTLSDLARKAPQPAKEQFRSLQRTLRGLADEIEAVLEDNRRLAEGGLGDVHTLLDAVIGTSTGDIYTDSGRRHRAPPQPVQLDRAL